MLSLPDSPQAASLVGAGASAVLGQPLDYVAQLRLDSADALTPNCVTAEVSVGDRRLPDASVRVLVEPLGADAARLRVQSTSAVDEPVVSVQINASCGASLSRRFVVFADPPAPGPSVMPVAAAPAFAAALPDVSQVSTPTSDATTRTPARADGAVAAAESGRSVALRQRVAGPTAKAPAARGTTRAQRRAEARAAKRREAVAARTARAAAPRATRVAVAEPARAPATSPRLKLDFAAAAVDSSSAVDQAMEAVAQAAAAARQSASAASAAADRIAALERTVEQLQGEARSSRSLATQLREQLAARTESGGPTLWLLAAAAAALAALAAWLALRLSATRRAQQLAWQLAARQTVQPSQINSGFASADSSRDSSNPHDEQTADTAPASLSTSGPRTRPSPAWPPPAPAEDWDAHDTPVPEPVPAPAPPSRLRVVSAPGHPSDSLNPAQATLPLPQIHKTEARVSPRDVSIDELLDLEQQAEFFVVLGQDDAAIELLVEHLRHTGGGSPLPYLKLLEIYRRRGDEADYERTRTRFNHRFNAYAPEWGQDLQAGRTLTDYPGVLPRLQQVWPRPLDSMAELEALLFRRSRGELFDLPAYREVLFLYTLARDLLDRESADTGLVDLLLPLSDGADFGVTAPAPYLELGRESEHGRLDFEDRPTAPVDLDLSFDSDRPISIFDPLDEHPRRRN